MKRLYISLILLGLICGLGIWNVSSLKGLATELSSLLDQAEAAAAENDWQAAEDLTQEARELWDKNIIYISITVHHNQIEEVETGFQSVEAFLHWQEMPEYTSANAALLAQIDHIWEAERFCVENLL